MISVETLRALDFGVIESEGVYMDQNTQNILWLVATILAMVSLLTFGFFIYRDLALWVKRYKQIKSGQNLQEEKVVLKPHLINEIIACVFYVFFRVIAECMSVPLAENESWMTLFILWPQYAFSESINALPISILIVMNAVFSSKFNRMPAQSNSSTKKQ